MILIRFLFYSFLFMPNFMLFEILLIIGSITFNKYKYLI
jgi:hypothetical protein